MENDKTICCKTTKMNWHLNQFIFWTCIVPAWWLDITCCVCNCTKGKFKSSLLTVLGTWLQSGPFRPPGHSQLNSSPWSMQRCPSGHGSLAQKSTYKRHKDENTTKNRDVAHRNRKNNTRYYVRQLVLVFLYFSAVFPASVCMSLRQTTKIERQKKRALCGYLPWRGIVFQCNQTCIYTRIRLCDQCIVHCSNMDSIHIRCIHNCTAHQRILQKVIQLNFCLVCFVLLLWASTASHT